MLSRDDGVADVALGGEREDLVLFEVDLQVLHELVGIGGLGLPVHDPIVGLDSTALGGQQLGQPP